MQSVTEAHPWCCLDSFLLRKIQQLSSELHSELSCCAVISQQISIFCVDAKQSKQIQETHGSVGGSPCDCPTLNPRMITENVIPNGIAVHKLPPRDLDHEIQPRSILHLQNSQVARRRANIHECEITRSVEDHSKLQPFPNTFHSLRDSEADSNIAAAEPSEAKWMYGQEEIPNEVAVARNDRTDFDSVRRVTQILSASLNLSLSAFAHRLRHGRLRSASAAWTSAVRGVTMNRLVQRLPSALARAAAAATIDTERVSRTITNWRAWVSSSLAAEAALRDASRKSARLKRERVLYAWLATVASGRHYRRSWVTCDIILRARSQATARGVLNSWAVVADGRKRRKVACAAYLRAKRRSGMLGVVQGWAVVAAVRRRQKTGVQMVLRSRLCRSALRSMGAWTAAAAKRRAWCARKNTANRKARRAAHECALRHWCAATAVRRRCVASGGRVRVSGRRCKLLHALGVWVAAAGWRRCRRTRGAMIQRRRLHREHLRVVFEWAVAVVRRRRCRLMIRSLWQARLRRALQDWVAFMPPRRVPLPGAAWLARLRGSTKAWNSLSAWGAVAARRRRYALAVAEAQRRRLAIVCSEWSAFADSRARLGRSIFRRSWATAVRRLGTATAVWIRAARSARRTQVLCIIRFSLLLAAKCGWARQRTRTASAASVAAWRTVREVCKAERTAKDCAVRRNGLRVAVRSVDGWSAVCRRRTAARAGAARMAEVRRQRAAAEGLDAWAVLCSTRRREAAVAAGVRRFAEVGRLLGSPAKIAVRASAASASKSFATPAMTGTTAAMTLRTEMEGRDASGAVTTVCSHCIAAQSSLRCQYKCSVTTESLDIGELQRQRAAGWEDCEEGWGLQVGQGRAAGLSAVLTKLVDGNRPMGSNAAIVSISQQRPHASAVAEVVDDRKPLMEVVVVEWRRRAGLQTTVQQLAALRGVSRALHAWLAATEWRTWVRKTARAAARRRRRVAFLNATRGWRMAAAGSARRGRVGRSVWHRKIASTLQATVKRWVSWCRRVAGGRRAAERLAMRTALRRGLRWWCAAQAKREAFREGLRWATCRRGRLAAAGGLMVWSAVCRRARRLLQLGAWSAMAHGRRALRSLFRWWVGWISSRRWQNFRVRRGLSSHRWWALRVATQRWCMEASTRTAAVRECVGFADRRAAAVRAHTMRQWKWYVHLRNVAAGHFPAALTAAGRRGGWCRRRLVENVFGSWRRRMVAERAARVGAAAWVSMTLFGDASGAAGAALILAGLGTVGCVGGSGMVDYRRINAIGYRCIWRLRLAGWHAVAAKSAAQRRLWETVAGRRTSTSVRNTLAWWAAAVAGPLEPVPGPWRARFGLGRLGRALVGYEQTRMEIESAREAASRTRRASALLAWWIRAAAAGRRQRRSAEEAVVASTQQRRVGAAWVRWAGMYMAACRWLLISVRSDSRAARRAWGGWATLVRRRAVERAVQKRAVAGMVARRVRSGVRAAVTTWWAVAAEVFARQKPLYMRQAEAARWVASLALGSTADSDSDCACAAPTIPSTSSVVTLTSPSSGGVVVAAAAAARRGRRVGLAVELWLRLARRAEMQAVARWCEAFVAARLHDLGLSSDTLAESDCDSDHHGRPSEFSQGPASLR